MYLFCIDFCGEQQQQQQKPVLDTVKYLGGNF